MLKLYICLISEILKLGIGDLSKQSKPRNHLSELFISEYILDKDLCVLRTVHAVFHTVK